MNPLSQFLSLVGCFIKMKQTLQGRPSMFEYLEQLSNPNSDAYKEFCDSVLIMARAATDLQDIRPKKAY